MTKVLLFGGLVIAKNEINKMYLKNYDKISEEMKYVANSLLRLRLLFSLYECPMTMKEINSKTRLSYSAISSHIHALEAIEYVTRKESVYYLSNTTKILLRNLLEFNNSLNVLRKFYNILENHKVRGIPDELISKIYMIEDSQLLESSGMNAYKINSVIIDTINKSDSLRIILPISFQELTESINTLIENNTKIELKVSNKIFDDFTRGMNLESISVKNVIGDFNFLLIIADETMILGLYKKDGNYDQNRILISKSHNSLKWANALYEAL